jgi:hypothetical protein
MDIYKKECEACWCKKAEELRFQYDVWINCNACPFTECYEPDTREQFLSGVTEREVEYMRIEEYCRLQKMKEEEYKQTLHFRKQKSFAETIRYKVKNNILLSPKEFKKALAFDDKDARLLNFFSFTDIIKYQMSLLGYSEGAKMIANYIENCEEY